MEFDINPNELSLQGPDGMQLVQILRKLIVAIDGGDEPEPTQTTGLYYCTYGKTTSAQIAQAITDGLLPVCVYGVRYYCLVYRQVNIFTFASVDQTQLILYRIKCNGSTWSYTSVYLQEYLDFDYAPTEGSTNPVTSGGVWTAIQQGGGGSDIDPYQQYPAMDGTASPGSSDDYARGDHVHPTDTSRAAASEITRIDAALAGKADQASIQQTIEDTVDDWLTVQAPSIGTLSYAAKRALLNLLQHVAYDHADDAQYYSALESELFPDATLQSITAVFTQGSAVIYDTDSLDTLKQYLTVTATYSDSTTETVTNYTLSGTLTGGTSTITVSYGGKTDTFDVTVSEHSPYLYALSSPFTSTGLDVIDTNVGFEANKTYTFLCDHTKNGTPSAVSYIYGNKSTTNTYLALQLQNAIMWGVGISYNNGKNLGPANKRIRTVAVVAFDANGACSVSMHYKNITDSGTVRTFSNTYTNILSNTKTVCLGDSEGTGSGAPVTVHDFKIYNGSMPSADIDDYLTTGA